MRARSSWILLKAKAESSLIMIEFTCQFSSITPTGIQGGQKMGCIFHCEYVFCGRDIGQSRLVLTTQFLEKIIEDLHVTRKFLKVIWKTNQINKRDTDFSTKYLFVAVAVVVVVVFVVEEKNFYMRSVANGAPSKSPGCLALSLFIQLSKLTFN